MKNKQHERVNIDGLIDIYSKCKKNPRYQRDLVWRRDQKELLIDSIIRDCDIPKFYLIEIEDDRYEYEIIDGKQRLESIYQFYVTNNIKLNRTKGSLLIDGKKTVVEGAVYKNLADRVKNQIKRFQFDLVIYKRDVKDVISDLFFRLSNGTPLTKAQMRSSISGDFNDLIHRFAEHPFILNKFSGSKNRKAHHTLLTKMYHYLAHPNSSCNNYVMEKHYRESYKKGKLKKEFEEVEERLQESLDLMDSIYSSKDFILNHTNTFLIFALLEDFEDVIEEELAIAYNRILTDLVTDSKYINYSRSIAKYRPNIHKEMIDHIAQMMEWVA